MILAKKRRKIKYLFLILPFSFLIYYFQDPIKNEVYLISSAINQFFLPTTDRLGNFFATFFEFEKIKEENRYLSSKMKELIVEKERWRQIEKENEILRKALDLSLEKDFKMQLAQVVGKDVSGDILIINKGEKEGIKEGEVVITSEKVLVGKISKTYNNFSKVRMFTDKNFAVNVKIGEKETEGLVKGDGNLKANIQFIPKEEKIGLGEKIFTSNLGNNFPAGLLVGEVEKLEKIDTEFYQKVFIKPALEIDQLKFVFVVSDF